VKKTSQNFWRELKKWSAFSLIPPCAGSVEKQDFVNNQALIKRTLIFTLFRKTQNCIQIRYKFSAHLPIHSHTDKIGFSKIELSKLKNQKKSTDFQFQGIVVKNFQKN